MISRYVDAGVRLEFMKWPLPGYENDFSGWGVPHIYAKGRYKGFELTAGDFYEQFGSGFILRTYEERSLGIDNSIRGGRLRVTAIPGVRITALGGVQRRYWDWKTSSQVYAGIRLHPHLRPARPLSLRHTGRSRRMGVSGQFLLQLQAPHCSRRSL